MSFFAILRLEEITFRVLCMKRKMMGRLIDWKSDNSRAPLLLKGVRQVGKTFLLKEFGKVHFPKYHYFNFEQTIELRKIFEGSLVPERILTELSFQVGSTINIEEDLVIFDEIQECPRALTSLKYFKEDCPKLHLCAAGSLLGLHLNSGSFPVGKVTFETLRPMTFEEFLIAIDDKSLPFFEKLTSKATLPEAVHLHLWEQLKLYFVVGGLPESIATYIKYRNKPLEAFLMVRKKQKDLLQAYYSDIAKHAGKVNAMHIDRVFNSVPSQLSGSHNIAIRRYRFRGVVPGVSHYDRLSGAIDWLEQVGMIIKIPIVNSAKLPFLGFARENFFKLVMFDVGILGCMSELSAKAILDADYGSYKGYFAENFVAQELVAILRKQLYSWQEQKFEVEFLTEDNGKVIPIEVKSGKNTKAKSLQVFCKKYQPPYKVVFSKRPLSISKESNKIGNTHYYPLYLAGQFSL